MSRYIDKILGKESSDPGPKHIKRSMSDDQRYPQMCLDASNDFSVFATFRRNPAYTRVLEHVTEEVGQSYLDLVKADPEVFAALDEFRRNDLYGHPRTFLYPDAGEISPTTIRYAKVLSDIKGHFGSLDGMNIAEIGVGYGGQCRVINGFFRPATYRMVDIQPALALAQRFLDNFILHSQMSYRVMNELAPEDYDLCISNYAVTELPRDIQDVYLQKVVLRSKRGYISYNAITPPEFNSYKADELLEVIPGAKKLEETPLTHARNCLIVWGAEG